MKLVRFSNYFYGAAPGTGFHQDRQPGTPCKPGGTPRGQRVELFSSKKKQRRPCSGRTRKADFHI